MTNLFSLFTYHNGPLWGIPRSDILLPKKFYFLTESSEPFEHDWSLYDLQPTQLQFVSLVDVRFDQSILSRGDHMGLSSDVWKLGKSGIYNPILLWIGSYILALILP